MEREVWARDKGRCAFIGTEGRCPERGFLELHHVIPFADGGPSDPENLQLRCRAHNTFEAEAWFGPMQVREVTELYRTRSGPSVLTAKDCEIGGAAQSYSSTRRRACDWDAPKLR